jgi:hypothetical protein
LFETVHQIRQSRIVWMLIGGAFEFFERRGFPFIESGMQRCESGHNLGI